MNRKQTIVMWIGIGVFVLMGLYPPTPAYKRGLSYGRDWNYTFILDANEVVLEKLVAQWAILAAVTGGLIYTLGIYPNLFQKIWQNIKKKMKGAIKPL
jgi:hypothetical protein